MDARWSVQSKAGRDGRPRCLRSRPARRARGAQWNGRVRRSGRSRPPRRCACRLDRREVRRRRAGGEAHGSRRWAGRGGVHGAYALHPHPGVGSGASASVFAFGASSVLPAFLGRLLGGGHSLKPSGLAFVGMGGRGSRQKGREHEAHGRGAHGASENTDVAKGTGTIGRCGAVCIQSRAVAAHFSLRVAVLAGFPLSPTIHGIDRTHRIGSRYGYEISLEDCRFHGRRRMRPRIVRLAACSEGDAFPPLSPVCGVRCWRRATRHLPASNATRHAGWCAISHLRRSP